MSILDTVKKLFAGKTKEAVSSLGLDSAVSELLGTLVSKLTDLQSEGKLEDAASSALSAFKPIFEKFTSGSVDAGGLLEKAKSFLSSLSGITLPDEIKGLVEKLTGLLNK